VRVPVLMYIVLGTHNLQSKQTQNNCATMKLYCLSNDPNKPCHILTFKEITMMLDCGLSMQSVLNFLPLSFVPSSRLLNLPNWMPTDVSDSDLEGVNHCQALNTFDL
jgi:hypothetical protein